MIQENISKMLNLQAQQLKVNGCVDSTIEAAQISELSLSLQSASLLIASEGTVKENVDLSPLFSKLFDAVSSPHALQAFNNKISKQLSSAPDVCTQGGVSPDTTDDAFNPAEQTNIDKANPHDVVYACVVISTAFILIWFFYAIYQYKFGRIKNEDEETDAIERFFEKRSDSVREINASVRKELVSEKRQAFSWLCCSWYEEVQVERMEKCEDEGEAGGEGVHKEGVQGKRVKVLTEKKFWYFKDALIKHWQHLDGSEMLILNPRFPIFLRFSLPFLIIGNIILFIYSNIALDAVSVIVNIHLGQETITLPPVFNFGLAGTVTDMWNARVWLLAVLVAFFSGAWPYIKVHNV